MFEKHQELNDCWFGAFCGDRLVIQYARPDDIGFRPYIRVRHNHKSQFSILTLAWLHQALWIGIRNRSL
jgi:hypothetical protein